MAQAKRRFTTIYLTSKIKLTPFQGGWGNVVDEQTKLVIMQRLANASEHLIAAKRLTLEDASCIGVIRQIQMVQAALNKVCVMMLAAQLDRCIFAAVQGEDISERERVLGEVTSIFEVSKLIQLN